MKKGFLNTRQKEFISGIVTTSLDSESCDIMRRCKFNFSYFDVQSAGQDFRDWDHQRLIVLLGKLKEYGKEGLTHWMNKPVGKTGNVLAIYGAFPKNSDFKMPKHVPHQAQWGRFRLDSASRLVGFVVPKEYGLRERSGDGYYFDCNTFYVVFLDGNHCFYKTTKK